MTQITTRLPDELVEALDRAARLTKLSRSDVVRLAIERYLEDSVDLAVASARLRDSNDPALDWDVVKRGLLNRD